MKTLTPIQVQNEINRRNKLFKGKSAAQKRVLICKDVLDLIEENRLQAKSGHFIYPYFLKEKSDNVFLHEMKNFPRNESLQELFLKKEINICKCCALGSIMLSCTLFNNQETIDDVLSGELANMGNRIVGKESFKNKFNKIFSQKQLILIEVAFEKSKGFFNAVFSNDKAKKLVKKYSTKSSKFEKQLNRASNFGEDFLDNTSILKGIMENIIKNRGEFKP